MLTRRRAMMAPLAAAGSVAAAKVPAFAQAATPAAAVDLTAGEGATIDVVGTGEASAEATGGILQFVLRTDGSAGGKTDPTGTFEPSAVTEEQVAAVVEAVTQGGVPEAAIVSAIAGSAFTAGAFGPGTAVVAAQLDENMLAQVDRIIERAGEAGTAAGLLFDPVNVAYVLPDCASLEEAALADAVADGEAQARSLADALGVTLGPLVKATKQPSYGGPGYYGAGAGGGGTVCQETPTLEDGLRSYFPAYDATRRGEVELYAQVGLSFAIS